MARLAASRRVLRQEVDLDAGQFLTGKPVARLPDELQLCDGGRRSSTNTNNEELTERQRLPRAAVQFGGLSVGERAVERVRSVMTARRTRELTQHAVTLLTE